MTSARDGRPDLMRRLCLIAAVALFAPACICGSMRGSSPDNQNGKELYVSYMGMAGFPAELSNFRLISSGIFDNAYFEYDAPPTYFESVGLVAVDCQGYRMPDDYAYWTDKQPEIAGRVCYAGIINSIAHYVIYDPSTTRASHFTDGVRE